MRTCLEQRLHLGYRTLDICQIFHGINLSSTIKMLKSLTIVLVMSERLAQVSAPPQAGALMARPCVANIAHGPCYS